MNQLLDKQFVCDLGFIKPNISEYEKDNFKVYTDDNKKFFMLKDGLRWMTWNEKTYNQVFEVYSHFILAHGHCVCTGMGFLIRENWLLSKKEVTKVTVIEKNIEVIDYHKKFNPDILDKIEVIHADVYDCAGQCDTLLIDNFEGELSLFPHWLYSTKLIATRIKSNITWMWPLEVILSSCYRNYIGLSLSEIYFNIKKYYDLDTLPDLTEEQLFHFCYVHHRGNFHKCDFSKLRS